MEKSAPSCPETMLGVSKRPGWWCWEAVEASQVLPRTVVTLLAVKLALLVG